ncbi:hypothetical protein PHYSODRAFT_332347 [Phytophthora sojae]|uniref:Ankyrin repeat-containing domain n=1 Tax=Phytophthora sojae (strain P6497) TaxID=1094619 RepID=G4ZGF3_PHYSP|nr:hypothetical protein PHYSODRAFT_332347 [Phytophthora sojae]EGZ18598.1 hypothetical protein PHYSODRAFT_332347 [Phytophthora sojae]|eukprot:XP_009527656.1 hypothetical protein PHYSODRAFT_332347 [Phytophthora sojae]
MSSDTSSSSSSERALESSDSDDSSSSKRVCTIMDVDEAASPLPSVDLPVEIQKLPLVLQRAAALWMTPEDAVLQAAASGQSGWLKQLLNEFMGTLEHAAATATSEGNTLQTVLQLLHELDDPCRRCFGSDTIATLEKAAIIAARSGHLDTVELLLRSLEVRGKVREEAAWKVLEEAAVHGHLAVVQFASRYVIRTPSDDERCTDSKAVSLAIAGGYVDVVVYLLRYPWNVASAFMEAVRKQQHVIAEKIYQVFPFYFEGKNLFVEMAGDGFLIAVQYLYERGHNDENLVQDAFLKAATGMTRRTEVMEFLIGTGRVLEEVFDTAFEAVATSGSVSTVTFLYEQQFASLRGIYRAFERAGSLSVTKFLFLLQRTRLR